MSEPINPLHERIAKHIAKLLIEVRDQMNWDLTIHQKSVKADGVVRMGRDSSKPAVVYQSDVKAAIEDSDLFKVIAEAGVDDPETQLTLSIDPLRIVSSLGAHWDLINEAEPSLSLVGQNNPVNIGQFLDLQQTTTTYNDNAAEVLNNNIFELLPQTISRQAQINSFFAQYESLKGQLPIFTDEDGDGTAEEITDSNYDIDNTSRISELQDMGLNDSQAFITRTESESNTKNTNKSLEWLRDDLNLFLKDIDKTYDAGTTDEREDYVNKSDGFLELRHLNQGIIIRKQEGDDIGIGEQVIVTQDINNNGEYTYDGPSYLTEGFTITMWVKFLDRVNEGTLFNYGNPLRRVEPKGFSLETYVIHNEEEMSVTTNGLSNGNKIRTWQEYSDDNNLGLFSDNDYLRFLRLVVREENIGPNYETGLRDSHIGLEDPTGNNERHRSNTLTSADTLPDFGTSKELLLLNHTQVPINLDEWYYIVASYDPTINEDGSLNVPEMLDNKYFWQGHLDEYGWTGKSGMGAKCKVEVISRTDILRARGFKTD